jgi:ATP-binding cassette subfamily C protein
MGMQSRVGLTAQSEVSAALRSCRGAFGGVALFSAVINILMLTGSIYMLQIYDRVLASRSLSTLVGISLIVLAAYLLQGALDALRSKMLARIGARFDELLSVRVFELVTVLPLKGPRSMSGLQPVRDLDQIRGFLSGLGPTALFDMPFMPVFFAGCFLLHPWLGALAVAGGLVIMGFTLLTEARSRAPIKDMTQSANERHAVAELSRRNAEAVRALGMRHVLSDRYAQANERHVADGLRASDAAAGIGAAAKIFRMILQSAGLGLGAYLVIQGELTGGAMIATSILMSRALAPIEIAVANWKGFISARQSYVRLQQTLALAPRPPERIALPAPRSAVTVQDLVVAAPGSHQPIVLGASLQLKAGQALGLIGPSASGKSTMARALVGVWPTLRGEVRLDGATLDQWEPDDLGRHIGYLPQDVELFEGTVAENIARFRPDASAESVIAAARAAGAHDMILQLPNGYDTRIGESGAVLSGGQRQRVALARALFGDPFLVVLDEPNASLDGAGDDALNQAILGVRQRGGAVVIITHRPAALGNVDLVGIMEAGRIKTIGPRDEVLKTVMRRPVAAAPAPTAQATAAGGAPAAGAAHLREVRS